MIEYLSVEEVIAMYDVFLQEFGGLPGIRDINLLISAVETPKGQITKEKIAQFLKSGE